ncbi:MAG: P-loop NTPase [Polyangiaceae bacterium]
MPVAKIRACAAGRSAAAQDGEWVLAVFKVDEGQHATATAARVEERQGGFALVFEPRDWARVTDELLGPAAIEPAPVSGGRGRSKRPPKKSVAPPPASKRRGHHERERQRGAAIASADEEHAAAVDAWHERADANARPAACGRDSRSGRARSHAEAPSIRARSARPRSQGAAHPPRGRRRGHTSDRGRDARGHRHAGRGVGRQRALDRLVLQPSISWSSTGISRAWMASSCAKRSASTRGLARSRSFSDRALHVPRPRRRASRRAPTTSWRSRFGRPSRRIASSRSFAGRRSACLLPLRRSRHEAPNDRRPARRRGRRGRPRARGARGASKVIAAGGGRGGVGKSLVAENLAIYLAQLGKAVVLVDADPTGANLHAHFGLSAAKVDPATIMEERGAPSSARSSTRWCRASGFSPRRSTPSSSRPSFALVARGGLGEPARSPADYLVVDVGSSMAPFPVDTMLGADISGVRHRARASGHRGDVSLLPRRVSSPPPPLAHARSLPLALIDRAIAEVGMLPAPLDVVRSLERMDKRLAELAWAEAGRMHMQLVVNQTRVRTDLELGVWMSELRAALRRVGRRSRVHRARRHRVALGAAPQAALVDSPTSKAARNLSASRAA